MELKFFSRDRLLRNSKGIPIGRVILAEDYKEGADLKVLLLEVPRQFYTSVLGVEVFVDGVKYKIPENIHPIRLGGDKLKHLINNIVIKKV